MYIWEFFIIIMFGIVGILLPIAHKKITWYGCHNSGHYNEKWGDIWEFIYVTLICTAVVLIPVIIVIICNVTLLDEMIYGFFNTKI